MKDCDTPYTPAHTLILAQNKAAEMILASGMEKVWANGARKAKAARAGLAALGRAAFSQAPSVGVTAFMMPEGVDGEAVVKKMRDEKHVSIAGGQDHLKGKIGRMAHMGYITEDDLKVGLRALAEVLTEMGSPADGAKAVKAFDEAMR
jgi:aspartate aminotransferase-like enzyme